MHADGAQAVGKIHVSVDDLGLNLLSVAGHKLYAAKGVGALYIRRGTNIQPLLVGAGQERGLRPGTENVASIVGLGAACATLGADHQGEADRIGGLRDLLWDTLSAAVPGLVRLTPVERAVPNTLLVSFPHATGWDILDASPTVAAATGSACHSGEHQASSAVLAMGINPEAAAGTVRLSLGRGTTTADIQQAAAALIAAFDTVVG